MSNTRVVDQQRNALRRTPQWQTAAQPCPRDLARLRQERVSDGPQRSAQAGLEAPCSSSSPMLDPRTFSPVPRYVPDPRAEGSRTSLRSDAQRRAPPGELLVRM